MRIISGIYGRRRFDLPKNFKARPTTDFAKENVFNVLNNLLDWEKPMTALDLFSGTGSIGFELLSRGCKKVVCVEKDAVHHAFIQKTAKELKTEDLIAVRGDVFTYISNTPFRFNIIFADPPYSLPEIPAIPDLIFSGNLLEEGGLFILEHSSNHSFKEHPRFLQQRVYGSVNFSLFE
ncbi:MAG: RsmD family RNA methyltransferase [Candidatus Azobacteroides sp.]|nr:RsmD family RNA methyltransferase [Candidatus Azobacteroides sp.]